MIDTTTTRQKNYNRKSLFAPLYIVLYRIPPKLWHAHRTSTRVWISHGRLAKPVVGPRLDSHCLGCYGTLSKGAMPTPCTLRASPQGVDTWLFPTNNHLLEFIFRPFPSPVFFVRHYTIQDRERFIYSIYRMTLKPLTRLRVSGTFAVGMTVLNDTLDRYRSWQELE
jgi:hypothetical protein